MNILIACFVLIGGILTIAYCAKMASSDKSLAREL